MTTRQSITVTTDSSGDGTSYTAMVSGRIKAIQYTKVDFSNGVDFTITTETTLQTVWTEANVNASKLCCPRMPLNGTDGVAALYAAAGLPVLGEYVEAMYERIKVVVAQGGAVKTGTFVVFTDD